jgi:hypothetical protein
MFFLQNCSDGMQFLPLKSSCRDCPLGRNTGLCLNVMKGPLLTLRKKHEEDFVFNRAACAPTPELEFCQLGKTAQLNSSGGDF